MIQLTQEEVNAFNIISAQANNIKTQLEAAQAAQKAFINLLELKYDAVFDEKTGQLKEKEKVEV